MESIQQLALDGLATTDNLKLLQLFLKATDIYKDLEVSNQLLQQLIANQNQSTQTADSVLNACISYVIHGDANFEGMHTGLVDYFKRNVKSRLKKSRKKNV